MVSRFYEFGLVVFACSLARDAASATQAVQPPVNLVDGQIGSLQGGAVWKYRQTLTNYHDLQYVTYLNIGKQTIAGIIDTGSFELVVFSKDCISCGKAGKYDPSLSSSYHLGTLTNRLTYGSGDTFTREAFDFLSIGSRYQVNQTFWEVTDAQMPVLVNAEFQAIIGVGPPETPAADAWGSAHSQVSSIRRFLARGAPLPVTTLQRAKTVIEVAVEMSRSAPMLGNVGVSVFSVCLGSKPGTDGYFVWNDTLAAEEPALFVRMPVVGRHTWTLNLTGAWLAERHGVEQRSEKDLTGDAPTPLRTSLGCASGCGAIVDSGTSMLVVPATAIEVLNAAVQRMDADCSNIHELPDLLFDFNGVQVSLPPDSYMAEVLGEVPSYLEALARVRRLRKEGSRCELLVMESSSDTNYGPLWILGMPFFRSYYTSFQVGRSMTERAIFLSPAGEDCSPGDTVSLLASERSGNGGRYSMRRIDPSKMLVSHNAWRASTNAFMML